MVVFGGGLTWASTILNREAAGIRAADAAIVWRFTETPYNQPMLIETHAHLDYPEFANDFDDVLRRAADAGVTRMITIGTSIESSQRAIDLARGISDCLRDCRRSSHRTCKRRRKMFSRRCANWRSTRALWR